MVVDKNALRRIEELSNVKGPSGFEDEVCSLVRSELADVCDIEEDSFRNLYLYSHKNTGNRPVVMIDAHSDEVGFMVQSIKPNGTLRFLQLGGWNSGSLPGTKVLVRNRDGQWITGVIAAKPPHFMTAEERAANRAPSPSDMVIDVGAVSAEDAIDNYGVRIGEPVTADVAFSYDENHDRMFGKAFDCRVGCAALVEVMRRVSELDLKVDVVGVMSSQEELGERGSRVSVNHVKPAAAICFEGTPADDTFSDSYAVQTAVGKGPMFRFMDVTAICNPRFQRLALDTAEKNGIPAQAAVREGGGTDAASIQTATYAAPAIVAGVPVRYIHSPHCIASYHDYDASVRLVIELLKIMDSGVIESF
jgi:Cellulase M and related proteins